jgi:hypothetical protein
VRKQLRAFFVFLIAHWGTYRYGYLWSPGVEIADETVTASRNASAMLSFLPHPLAHLSRGAGSFAAEGLN